MRNLQTSVISSMAALMLEAGCFIHRNKNFFTVALLVLMGIK